MRVIKLATLALVATLYTWSSVRASPLPHFQTEEECDSDCGINQGWRRMLIRGGGEDDRLIGRKVEVENLVARATLEGAQQDHVVNAPVLQRSEQEAPMKEEKRSPGGSKKCPWDEPAFCDKVVRGDGYPESDDACILQRAEQEAPMEKQEKRSPGGSKRCPWGEPCKMKRGITATAPSEKLVRREDLPGSISQAEEYHVIAQRSDEEAIAIRDKLSKSDLGLVNGVKRDSSVGREDNGGLTRRDHQVGNPGCEQTCSRAGVCHGCTNV